MFISNHVSPNEPWCFRSFWGQRRQHNFELCILAIFYVTLQCYTISVYLTWLGSTWETRIEGNRCQVLRRRAWVQKSMPFKHGYSLPYANKSTWMLTALAFRPTQKTVTKQNKKFKEVWNFLILKGRCKNVFSIHKIMLQFPFSPLMILTFSSASFPTLSRCQSTWHIVFFCGTEAITHLLLLGSEWSNDKLLTIDFNSNNGTKH